MDRNWLAQLELPEIIPYCPDCVHYYVTHDAVLPHGCRALHFHSRRLPMLDVFEASGSFCEFFTLKKRR